MPEDNLSTEEPKKSPRKRAARKISGTAKKQKAPEEQEPQKAQRRKKRAKKRAPKCMKMHNDPRIQQSLGMDVVDLTLNMHSAGLGEYYCDLADVAKMMMAKDPVSDPAGVMNDALAKSYIGFSTNGI